MTYGCLPGANGPVSRQAALDGPTVARPLAMETLDAIARRRSIRAYTPADVEPDRLERVLGALREAPSAGNLQAYEVVVVREAPRRAALARAAGGQGQVERAPVVLVFLADPDRSARKYGKRGAALYALQDATIACAFAMLAASDQGLGTCWIGAFDEEAVRRAVEAPAPLRPVALLAMGHAAEAPAAAPRRRLADLCRRERF